MVNPDNLQSFLGSPTNADQKASYSDYSNKIWQGAGQEATGYGIVDPPMFEHMPRLDEALKAINGISDMLGKVKNGSAEALEALKREFKVDNEVQKVVLPTTFVGFLADKAQREDGLPANEFKLKDVKFGVQDIQSNEQYERLQQEVTRMKQQYGEVFGNMEIYRVRQGDNKEVAVVVGLEDVALFNSVRAAEAKQRTLDTQVKSLFPENKDKELQANDVGPPAGLNIGNKIAELKTHYDTVNPNKPQQQEASTEITSQPSLPGQQKSNVREVA